MTSSQHRPSRSHLRTSVSKVPCLRRCIYTSAHSLCFLCVSAHAYLRVCLLVPICASGPALASLHICVCSNACLFAQTRLCICLLIPVSTYRSARLCASVPVCPCSSLVHLPTLPCLFRYLHSVHPHAPLYLRVIHCFPSPFEIPLTLCPCRCR